MDNCIFATMMFTIIAFFIGLGIGLNVGSSTRKELAISAGVGKYTVNEKTGVTKFEYIKPEIDYSKEKK